IARDLQSTNGTYVDGVRAQPQLPLPHGALLELGSVSMYFVAWSMVSRPPTDRGTAAMASIAPAAIELRCSEIEDVLVLRRERAHAVLERPGHRALELTSLELELLDALIGARRASRSDEYAYL